MYLPLEDRPLLRLPALRVGPTTIVGKESLLPMIVQATLIFGVIGPLRDARLAEEIGGGIAALVPAMSLLAVIHPQQVPTVHGRQFCPAIRAIEGYHGLRFHKIAYVADASKRGFGQPSGINGVPEPKQRQQDFEEIGVIQGFPDRQLHEVVKGVPIVLGYPLDTGPGLFSMGNEVEAFTKGVILIPSTVWVILVK
jgi:hypothetical protein